MSKLSFFKLPALFSISSFLLSVIISNVFLYLTFYGRMPLDDYDLQRITAQITNNFLSGLFWGMFYFFIAALVCYKYKLHRVNANNIIVMLVSAVMFCLLLWAESFLWSYFVVSYLVPVLMADGYLIVNVSALFTLITLVHVLVRIILAALLILLLFKLLRGLGKDNDQDFEFNTTNNRRIYATLYTLLFYAPLFIFVSYLFFSLLSSLTMSMDISPFITVFSVILSVVVLLLFVYFSTRNCFVPVFPTLQVARLFKSWGISLGLFFVFYLIVSFIFYLVLNQYLVKAFYYGRQLEDMIILSMLIIFVINYVALYFINRFAVRCCFSESIR